MPNKHEITFNIDDDGSVTFEVHGVKGPQCLEITKAIEKELGDVVEQKKTSEYYEAAVEEQAVVSASLGDDGDDE